MFEQYPDDIAVHIYESSEIQLTDARADVSTQLKYFGLQVFKHGVNSGVHLYVKAYTTSDVLIATSKIVKASDIPGTYFYGWVYFEFDQRINFPSTSDVRFKLFVDNYTFSESDWVGAVYDWPITMGYNGTPDQIQDAPFAIDIIGAS
jgi:hypothetical protein